MVEKLSATVQCKDCHRTLVRRLDKNELGGHLFVLCKRCHKIYTTGKLTVVER